MLVSVYVPVVKLNDILLASENAPIVTVVAVALLFDTLMTGVPVMVTLVGAMLIAVPDPVQTMFPVPNAMVLAKTVEFPTTLVQVIVLSLIFVVP